MDTPQNRGDMPDADRSRWVSTEAVAAIACFLLSDEARAVNGAAVGAGIGSEPCACGRRRLSIHAAKSASKTPIRRSLTWTIGGPCPAERMRAKVRGSIPAASAQNFKERTLDMSESLLAVGDRPRGDTRKIRQTGPKFSPD